MDLIAFGSVFLEIVFGHVPPPPGPGEEIYADEFAISCGGAVTAASAASAMDVSAGLSTVLGLDLGSRVVREYCSRARVDLSTSRHVSGRAAGVTVVLNYDGDRAFISYLPPRPAALQPEPERWLETLRAERPSWCYLHAGPGMSALMREARSLGIRIALDVGLNAISSDPEAVVSCVRLADVFLPNTEELLRLTRAGSLAAAIDTAVSWGPPVVVKRGADGAIVADRAGQTEVTDGIRPVRVRDRTGAGDAFAGALIGGLHQGASMTEAARAGNAAGSETVNKLGAVGEVDVDWLSEAAPPLAAAVLAAAGERAALSGSEPETRPGG